MLPNSISHQFCGSSVMDFQGVTISNLVSLAMNTRQSSLIQATEIETMIVATRKINMIMPPASKADSKATLDAAAWAFNIVTSVGIIIVNKALMATYGFRFATTLTGLHFATTTLMTVVLRWMGHIQSSHLPASEILKFVVFANFSIVGMNVSLMWNSVGFYQIAKLSMIPVSCFLEVFLGKKRYSRDTKLSILLVLLGVAICTVTDMSVNAKGFIAAFVAVWATALQQYYVHFLQKKYALGSFNLLGHTAPVQAASLLLLGPFVDYCLTNKMVGAYPYSTTSVVSILGFYKPWMVHVYSFACICPHIGCLLSVLLTCHSKLWQYFIILSCTIAIGTNLSQFICIGRFSALTFQVLGHMKTILILTLGFIFFGKEGLNLHVVLGMVIAILGMIWYGNASSKPGGTETRTISSPHPKTQNQNGLSESSELDEKV
ncbi:hypothetical protein C3L33_01944, partial [Rhododendron williamsianum]